MIDIGEVNIFASENFEGDDNEINENIIVNKIKNFNEIIHASVFERNSKIPLETFSENDLNNYALNSIDFFQDEDKYHKSMNQFSYRNFSKKQMKMKIVVEDLKGNKEVIKINDDEYVEGIKRELSLKTGVNENMILYYKGEILEDYKKVYDYEIRNYKVIKYKGCFTEIEKEPDDIFNYSCLWLYEILNNCYPQNYEWELFPKEIAANQLQQEGGTCYMVSALEAMSHIPFLLNYIFNTFDTTFSEYSKKYKVNFSNKSYTVLNQFPRDTDAKIPILKFIKPLEKEAYAIIFEKVWAVIRKGYCNINGGHSKEVFEKVLAGFSQIMYNNKMNIFDLKIHSETKQQIIHSKKSDEFWIKKIICLENNKINPKDVFEIIENAFKKDGAIITTSINMISDIEKKLEEKKCTNEKEYKIYKKLYDINFDYTILSIHKEGNQNFVKIKTSDYCIEISEFKKEDNFNYKIFDIPEKYFEFYFGGHEYSILGTYSLVNPWTEKIQQFVIIKNPWRGGGYDIEEKINFQKIENQIYGFNDIININKQYNKTGVFYMPKEYFDGWFRDITICTPNYEEKYPKVYEHLELYKTISKEYKVNSSQYFFNFNQGNQLIKTDIISKKDFDSNKKLIQIIKSNFVYAFKQDSMETIFWSGKKAYNFQKATDDYIVQKGFKFEVKKEYELNQDDFCGGKVYNTSITYSCKNDKYYRTIKLNEINYDNLNFKYNYYHYLNDSEEEFFEELKNDLKYLEKFEYEIKDFCEKCIFKKRGNTNIITDGWITISEGLNLISNKYSDDHYHCYFYGNKQTNLFELIGKEFQCSCYLIQNNVTVRNCNKTFTFLKTVRFCDCTYYIDGVKKYCPKEKYDEYDLEKIKNNKLFII